MNTGAIFFRFCPLSSLPNWSSYLLISLSKLCFSILTVSFKTVFWPFFYHPWSPKSLKIHDVLFAVFFIKNKIKASTPLKIKNKWDKPQHEAELESPLFYFVLINVQADMVRFLFYTILCLFLKTNKKINHWIKLNFVSE
jgi:hypothetical protein